MNYKLIGMIIVVSILVAGCIQPPHYNTTEEKVYKYKEYNEYMTLISGDEYSTVIVVHDDERNVTCWIYKDGYAGGISCIPDSQLNNS